MALKFPPIKRSTVVYVLSLLISLLGGNALPPLPLIGDEPPAPVCPPSPPLPAPGPPSPVAPV